MKQIEFTIRPKPKFTKKEVKFGVFVHYHLYGKKRNTERVRNYRAKKKALQNKVKSVLSPKVLDKKN